MTDLDLLLSAIKEEDLVKVQWILGKFRIKNHIDISKKVLMEAVLKNNLTILTELLSYGFTPFRYSPTYRPETNDCMEVAYLKGYLTLIDEFKSFAITRAYNKDTEQFPISIPDELYRSFEIKQKLEGDITPDLREFIIDAIIDYLNL